MTNPPGKDQLIDLYRRMQLIRRCEEQLVRSHQRGLIHGACHTYIGQEAIAAGVCAHLGPQDTVFSTHRGHGHALAKGVPAVQLIAELFGRAMGCSRGRGGSMHLFSPEVGLMGTSGIVGPCILQAAGAGYSFKLMRTGRVAAAFFGDGAVNNGAFHEGLNLASIWKLPVLFVCENNHYATEVPFKYSAGNPSVANRAGCYGMPGVELDGNSVLDIYAAAGEAVERARGGGGPTLLECRTYRTRPHSEGMGDFTYRTKEEVEEWKARCPILRLRQTLAGQVPSLTGQVSEVARIQPAPATTAEVSPLQLQTLNREARAEQLEKIALQLSHMDLTKPEKAAKWEAMTGLKVAQYYNLLKSAKVGLVEGSPQNLSHGLREFPTETELNAVDAAVLTEVEEAQRLAEVSPWPEPSSAATHVFAEPARVVPPDAQAPASPGIREISYMQATLEALSAEMAQNPRIFVLGEGIGKRGGNFKSTVGLYDLYGPERLCDTPISERGFVGLGCGAAMTGTRPVIDFMFADFVLDAAGEILNQIAKMQYMSDGRLRMPILLRGCIGISHSAATHHSGNYYPMYAHFPGLRVVVPSTPYDAKGLLHHALRCDDPVIFMEHRELLSLKGPVPEQSYEIPFGKAAVVREGKDVTVVALTVMVQRALKACQILEKEGVSVELIDPRTVSPLDTARIAESLAKTGRLLIADEAFAPCGIGAEIAAQLADAGFDDLDAPIRRLNGLHTPTPYSPTLEAAVVNNADAVAQAIRDLLAE